jgi:hypothetical protein
MNYLWQPCSLTDQDEICNLYRGPSIDASYQVSKLTDDGRQVMAKVHIAFGKVSEKEQSRETGNIGYTRRRKTKQKTKHMCWTPLITQTNTNNVNKTCALLQTTGDKDEPNIVFMWKSLRTSQHETQNVKTYKRTTQNTNLNRHVYD